jgi:hypothetical protein
MLWRTQRFDAENDKKSVLIQAACIIIVRMMAILCAVDFCLVFLSCSFLEKTYLGYGIWGTIGGTRTANQIARAVLALIF